MSRRTSRNLKEPAMFAIVLIALVVTVAVVARLVTVVMNDRPLTAPRSHTHELEPQSARLNRVV
jgi:multisubunit Na+/H+ antiporter MnhC subunit